VGVVQLKLLKPVFPEFLFGSGNWLKNELRSAGQVAGFAFFGQGCSEVALLGHACVSDARKEMRMSLVMRFFLGTRLANPIESPEPVVLGCVLMFSEWCQVRMNALVSFQKAAVALSNTGVGSHAFLSGYSFGQSNRVP
jgi:hypothetical protein